MEENQRHMRALILALGGVLLVGAFFFLWHVWVLVNTTTVNAVVEEKEALDMRLAPETNTESYSFQELFQPVIQPLEPIISYMTGSFLDESVDLDYTVKNDSPSYVYGGDKVVLSEKEIFQWTWSADYQIQLMALQDVMITDSFLNKSEKISIISTNEDVYKILGNLFDYALSKGWIVAVDADRLKKGLTELPRIVETDQAVLRAGSVPETILPGHQSFKFSPRDSRTLATTIIDGIKYVFSLPEVSAAQIPGVPGWHTAPDCYKDLVPINPVPGPNLLAFCCNCGLLCTLTRCIFIPDCGPFSKFCNIPLGCLNLMCKAWPNAIWDAFSNPLGTGICGCG